MRVILPHPDVCFILFVGAPTFKICSRIGHLIMPSFHDSTPELWVTARCKLTNKIEVNHYNRSSHYFCYFWGWEHGNSANYTTPLYFFNGPSPCAHNVIIPCFLDATNHSIFIPSDEYGQIFNTSPSTVAPKNVE